MKTTDKIPTTTINDTLTSIDANALEDITGGCGACGQTCAMGTTLAAAADSVNNAGRLAEAFGAFARR
jgi:hypothetical protein